MAKVMVLIWTAVALVCSSFMTPLIISSGMDAVTFGFNVGGAGVVDSRFSVSFGVGMVVCGLVFVLGLRFKYTPFFRARRPWMQSSCLNLIISGVAILWGVKNGGDVNVLVAQILFSIISFCWVEVARPVYDFGLLQNSLTLPVVNSIIHYKTFGVVFLMTSISLMVFCTVWNSYQSEKFAKLEEGGKALQRIGIQRDGIDGRNGLMELVAP